MEHVLSAQTRDETGKTAARRLRREGLIPGICYGRDRDTFGVAVDPDILARTLLRSRRRRNTVLELEVDGQRYHVMVQDLQRDPVKRTLVHVDFRLVSDEDTVVLPIPLEREGKSKAEDLGGRLIAVQRTVDVRSLVKDIPESVILDVGGLVIGDNVRVSDLPTPPGCEIIYNTDYVVLSVLKPRDLQEDEIEDEDEDEGEGEGDAGGEAAPGAEESTPEA